MAYSYCMLYESYVSPSSTVKEVRESSLSLENRMLLLDVKSHRISIYSTRVVLCSASNSADTFVLATT